MIEKRAVDALIEPYYRDKDIMHDMRHIEPARRQVEKTIALGNHQVNSEVLDLALAFHGFICREEDKVRAFLHDHGVNAEDTEAIVSRPGSRRDPKYPNHRKAGSCRTPMF